MATLTTGVPVIARRGKPGQIPVDPTHPHGHDDIGCASPLRANRRQRSSTVASVFRLLTVGDQVQVERHHGVDVADPSRIGDWRLADDGGPADLAEGAR